MSVDRAATPIRVPLRLQNIAASTAVVALAVGLYAWAPHNARQMSELFGVGRWLFHGWAFLPAVAGPYALALVAYYLLETHPRQSKSLRFFTVALRFARSPLASWRVGLVREDRVAVLTTLLKAFFAPFMVMALMQHVLGALANGWAVAATADAGLDWLVLFNQHGFWLAMKLILFVDVMVYTVGYLVESPRLDNEIRSVDPTILGWAAALLCYPPFNQVTGAILGSAVSDFPRFDDPTAHLLLNLLLLALMTIYAGASVALGLKASNLTHRGIVARGPYAWVRHPAYTAKNMAWWIGSAPFVAAAFGQSLFAGLTALATVAGWTLLYVLRAVTEEDHLRSVDGEYAAYAAKVRYRFVPGLV